MQKILILGGGYLSTALEAYFSPNADVIILDFPEIDITQIGSVRTAVATHKPGILINAAAWTDTNGAELPENQDKVIALNVVGPLNISRVAAEHHIPWFHFSTGMMFDGQPAHQSGWSETDTPETPENFYCLTKAWADYALLPFLSKERGYLLRIHLPISGIPHPRNFLNRMLSFAKAVNVESSVTVVEDLCGVMQALLEKQAPGGIYHVANPGTLSSFQLLEMMRDANLIPSDQLLEEMSREELDQITHAKGGAKQTFPILETKKLAELGITLPPVRESVARALARFAQG